MTGLIDRHDIDQVKSKLVAQISQALDHMHYHGTNLMALERAPCTKGGFE